MKSSTAWWSVESRSAFRSRPSRSRTGRSAAAPVGQQVGVAHEHPRLGAGDPLGDERGVAPAGDVGGGPVPAEVLVDVGGVPGVARLRDLRRVPEHGQEGQLRALRDRRTPPQVVEPERARVLDQHLLVGELLGSQAASRSASSSVGRFSASSATSGRASRVRITGERSSRSLWKSTTHCDSKKPRGLVSSAGTSGCGQVQPEHAERARDGAGAAAPGAGDHHQPGHSAATFPAQLADLPAELLDALVLGVQPVLQLVLLGQHRRLLLVGGERGRGGVDVGVRRPRAGRARPGRLASSGVATSRLAAVQVSSASSLSDVGHGQPVPGVVGAVQARGDEVVDRCGAVRSPVSMPSCSQARLIAERQSSTRS